MSRSSRADAAATRPAATSPALRHRIRRPGMPVLLAAVIAAGLAGVALTPSGAAAAPASGATHPVSRSVEPAHFKGLGFDACTAPSVADLKAWAKSPFRAVNIYIGGVNRGCPQPQLSKSWVSSVTEMGWDLIPTFVGLQAPQNVCGCASIVPGKAYSEGVSSADDAISEMESLGIGPHNPIYFDMEPYTPGKTNTGNVRAFLEGWTTRLHAKHYLSGVYSGSYSGIFDLAARYGTSYREPDDIWFANYNGVPSATDPAIPAADWASNQRIHQYEGSHDASYGGVTINVDSNYCDGGVVSKSSL